MAYSAQTPGQVEDIGPLIADPDLPVNYYPPDEWHFNMASLLRWWTAFWVLIGVGLAIAILVVLVHHHNHVEKHVVEVVDPEANGPGFCVLSGCIRIRQLDLPYTAAIFGQCYCFGEDLSWSTPFTPAITVTKQGVSVHADRYTLTISGQFTPGIAVAGSTTTLLPFVVDPPAQLHAPNMRIRTPTQQYSVVAAGFWMETGSQLTGEGIEINGMAIGVMNVNGHMNVKRMNITQEMDAFDANLAYVKTTPLFSPAVMGVISAGNTITHIEDSLYHCTKTSSNSQSIFETLWCVGIYHYHTPYVTSQFDYFGSVTLFPGVLDVDGWTSCADINILALRAASVHISRVNARFVGSGGLWEYGIGVWAGCGNNTNANIHNIDIIGDAMNPYGSVGLGIVSTHGVIARDVVVTGRTQLAPNSFDFIELPLRGPFHSALVFVDVFGDSPAAHNVMLQDFTVRALDDTTYCIAIASDALTNTSFSGVEGGCNPNFVVSMNNMNTYGGAVGLLVGSGMGGSLSVSDSKFIGNRTGYGIYMVNGSKNIDLTDVRMKRNCVGMRIEAEVEYVTEYHSVYSDNSANTIPVSIPGSQLISDANQAHPSTEQECNPPNLYDSCQQENVIYSSLARANYGPMTGYPGLFSKITQERSNTAAYSSRS